METRNKTKVAPSSRLRNEDKQKRKPVVIQYEKPNTKNTSVKLPESCGTKVNSKKKNVDKKEKCDLIANNKGTLQSESLEKVVNSTIINLNCDNDIDSKKCKWEPLHWREVLENIREMRKKGDAPVDTMGCDQTAVPNLDPKVHNLNPLVYMSGILALSLCRQNILILFFICL